MTEHERDYRRAVAAVEHAVASGLIVIPGDGDNEPFFGGEVDGGVLKVAEHFKAALT